MRDAPRSEYRYEPLQPAACPASGVPTALETRATYRFLRYVRAAVAVTISWYLETGHTNAPRGSIERAAASIR